VSWVQRLTWVEWTGVGLVAAGVAIAVWAGPNLATAIPAAIAATVGAALLVGAGIADRTRRSNAPVEASEVSRWAGVRSAFGHPNPIDRQEVVATLRALHRVLRHASIPPYSLAEEQRLLDESDAAFRAWAESQVEVLERET